MLQLDIGCIFTFFLVFLNLFALLKGCTDVRLVRTAVWRQHAAGVADGGQAIAKGRGEQAVEVGSFVARPMRSVLLGNLWSILLVLLV